jgi:glutathione S-transferase
LVYPGEGQGRRDRLRTQSWDGYVSGSAAAAHRELTDEEADVLFPPPTEQEAARRADTTASLRAARRSDDLADEELHWLLFGDTVGPETAG